jgi:chromosome segregation ATPase
MVNVSVAVPAFTSRRSSVEALTSDCDLVLGSECSLFSLVPVSGDISELSEVVAVPRTSLSLTHIEHTLSQRDDLQLQLGMAKEAMSAMNEELKRLRDYLSLNKTQRIKKLEDDNRKLQRALEAEVEKALAVRREKRDNEARLQAEVSQLKGTVSRLEGGRRESG